MIQNNTIKSQNTFQEEIDFLQTYVPSALYGISDTNQFLDSILSEISNEGNYINNTLDAPVIEQIDVNNFLDQLNSDNLAHEISSSLGFDFNLDFNQTIPDGLANLVAKLGRDAFGSYLSMHAFYNSNKTPWGIYLYPELIAIRANFLEKNRPHKITSAQYFALYFYAVYRHELFHYQTERLSTKLEVAFKRPFHKPYKNNVYSLFNNSEDWLEEALAEASVLDSILVAKRTKIDINIIRDIYKYDLKFMPPGYKDYHCEKYGGPTEAHKTFTSQIIQGTPNISHKTTLLFTTKGEFGSDDKKVPVYIVTGLKNHIRRVQ